MQTLWLWEIDDQPDLKIYARRTRFSMRDLELLRNRRESTKFYPNNRDIR